MLRLCPQLYLSLKIWKKQYKAYCLCVCMRNMCLFFVCFEDEKWVTCLNYPFSGLDASVPRHCIAWETKENTHFWRMAAETGRTQWNGRSNTTDPHPAPCSGLKVHKLFRPNSSVRLQSVFVQISDYKSTYITI